MRHSRPAGELKPLFCPISATFSIARLPLGCCPSLSLRLQWSGCPCRAKVLHLAEEPITPITQVTP